MGMKRKADTQKYKKKASKKQYVSKKISVFPEVKYYDVVQNLSTVSDAATGNPAYAKFFPVLGTDYNQRIGRQVQLKGIRMQGYWTVSNGVGGITEPFAIGHIALVLDRDPKGTVATLGEIFATSAGAVNANGIEFPNPLNKKRFKILYKKAFNFPQITIAAGGVFTQIDTIDQAAGMGFEHYVDCSKFKQKDQIACFNAAGAGAGTDLVENSILFLAWMGAFGGTTAGSWDVSSFIRTTYIDC